MKLYVWEAPYSLNVATDANEFLESNFVREASPGELLEAARPHADLEPLMALLEDYTIRIGGGVFDLQVLRRNAQKMLDAALGADDE